MVSKKEIKMWGLCEDLPPGWSKDVQPDLETAAETPEGRAYIYDAVFERKFLLVDQWVANYIEDCRRGDEPMFEFLKQPLLVPYLKQEDEKRSKQESIKGSEGRKPVLFKFCQETVAIGRGQARPGTVAQGKRSIPLIGVRHTGDRTSNLNSGE